EFAARGHEGRKYPWGDADPTVKLLNACDKDCGAAGHAAIAHRMMFPNDKDGYAETAPVGSFPAGNTPTGLSDMAGNVWEWTSSEWCDNYERKSCTKARVVRGGSWL